MDPAVIDGVRLNFQAEGLWALNGILGLIMFGVALDLRAADFRRVWTHPRGPLLGLCAQFLLLPAFTFLLTLIIQPQPSIALGMILVASCPGGNLSNFLAHLAGGNTALSVSMTAIATLAAMAMTPLNLTFWGHMNPATAAILTEVRLDPLELTLTVLLILGLPLAAGIAFANRFPRWAARLHKPFKFGSIFFFLAFVAFVFTNNLDVFTAYIGAVALAVVLHNVVALATGYGAARASGLPERDRRAVALEVGIQNSALGLSLIFTFFGGLGGMALVAGTWGIWHILSGLSVAWLWSRMPAKEAAEEPAA